MTAEIALAKGAPQLAAVVPDTPAATSAALAATPAAPFAIPVDGAIEDTFGMRKEPTGGQMKFHEGIDFVAPTGTAVKASAAGTVSYAGDRPGYGTVVEIDHDGGMKTRYAHLSRTDVKAGDAVTTGQLIGAVGSTGKSTEPHLHFEIWQDGKPTNPAPLLGLASNDG